MLNRPWRMVADLDDLPPSGDLRQGKVNALRELQSVSGAPKGCDKELSALMPSVLRPQGGAFKEKLL
jgi:hypothetical protein